MCPLVRELQRREAFDARVCATGQHREMLDQVLEVFGVRPDYDLAVMRSGQDLYDVTSRVLVGMRDVLRDCRPDLLLVHGDTTTSMAAALAGYYERIEVGHVEAGLRTRNIYSPWPEEMNRLLTARLATYHFAPTALSRANLMREGISDVHIQLTGNTVIDALHSVVARLEGDASLRGRVEEGLRGLGYDAARLDGARRMVLITGHRRENFGEGFLGVCRAIEDLAGRYADVDFVYPMHLNPNVREPIARVFAGGKGPHGNVFFIEPLEYLSFVLMMVRCHLVLTDSGGVQEEAPGLGKPVLVMRDTTERPEALEAGTVRLVGTAREVIVHEVSRLLDDPEAYAAMSRAVNPYGDGKACGRIADFLEELEAE